MNNLLKVSIAIDNLCERLADFMDEYHNITTAILLVVAGCSASIGLLVQFTLWMAS